MNEVTIILLLLLFIFLRATMQTSIIENEMRYKFIRLSFFLLTLILIEVMFLNILFFSSPIHLILFIPIAMTFEKYVKF